MKSNGVYAEQATHEVAPHWGAWIEMISGYPRTPTPRVAPHWGAWIEMVIDGASRHRSPVAPHWGAWIEMANTEMLRAGPRRTPLGCVD